MTDKILVPKVTVAKKKASPLRKPGRPIKDTDLREKILDQAEIAFSKGGYLGSSTRKIAVQAEVTQSLIRYYFRSKEELYQDVFRRRGKLLAARRLELLEKLVDSEKPFEVDDVIMAYIEPQWEMKYDQEGGAAFAAMQARLHSEPEEQALRLRREIYDGPVKRYLEVLGSLLPHIPFETLSVRMSFLVGTYMFMLNDLGRIGDFTDGQIKSLNKNEMLKQLVTFISAGLQADPP
ncbi:TetR/AcrR family transcriptional regulator [Dasania marina]|uniref:TetR/AcrR family transcriptional regulator n=1 Tax=Dasania marina TaxID=471499 RepID=UPI0030D8D9DE|tara:strand:- start:7474 stop:8178 length:705 start_codon:yes stop_codon:yes gene_type:complete